MTPRNTDPTKTQRQVTPIGSRALARKEWLSQPTGKRIGRTIVDMERDTQAARLRADGWSLRQIADRMGVHSKTAARMIERATAAVPVADVTRLRAIANEGIAGDMAALQKTIDSPPHVVAANGVVTSQENADAVTRAVDARTRLRARHARMNGYDAPQQTQVSVTMDEDWQAKSLALFQLAEDLTAQYAGQQTIQGQVEPDRPLLPGELPPPPGGWIKGGPGHDVWVACSDERCDCHRYDGEVVLPALPPMPDRGDLGADDDEED